MMRPYPMSVSGYVDGWMCWQEVPCRLNVVQRGKVPGKSTGMRPVW